MKMTRWRWLMLVLIVVVAGIAVLIVSLPRLIESTLEKQLAAFGVSEFTLGEPRWGLRGAGTSELRVRGVHQQWRYRIHITNFQALYTLGNLFNGEISALAMDSALIRVEAGESDAGKSDDLGLQHLVGNLETLDLPVDTVDLDNLQIIFRAPAYTVSLDAEHIAIDNRHKTLAGKVLATLTASDGETYPAIAVNASGGKLKWIPDLEAALIIDDIKRASAVARLGKNAGNTEDYPYRIDLNVELPQQTFSPNADKLPRQLKDILPGETVAELSVAGALDIPGILPLSQSGWYESLPFKLSGDAAVKTALPASGVDALYLQSGFALSGTLNSMVATLPRDLQALATLDGARAGLPRFLANADGKLDVEADVHLQGPVEIHRAAPGAIPLRFNVALGSETAALDSLAIQGAVTLKSADENVEVTAGEPLLVNGNTREGAFTDMAETAGWPVNHRTQFTVATAPNFALAFNPRNKSLNLTTPLALAFSIAPENGGHAADGTINLTRLHYQPGSSELAFNAAASVPYAGQLLPEVRITGDAVETGQGWKVTAATDIPDWKLENKSTLVHAATGLNIAGTVKIAQIAVIEKPVEALFTVPVETAWTDGSAQMNYDIDLGDNDTPAYKVDFEVKNLTGIVDGTALNNARLSGGFAIADKWQTVNPIRVRVDTLSTGVNVKDVQATVELMPSADLFHSRWLVQEFFADLFEGRIALKEPGYVDYPFAGNRLTFQVSNLQLSEVLVLYQEQGVSGRGILSGEVPIVLKPQGIEIAKGYIHGESPGGTLSFKSPKASAMANSNQQLATTLRILEDFRYDELNITTVLSPAGDLELAVSLKGQNPNEFEGRPINLNINLEENIFQLFKVLKLTDDLTRKIEERLENRSP